MANYLIPIPFMKTSEGKLSDNPNDRAAANPCPFPFRDGKQYHTNCGWTWAVFSSIFGNTQAAANRFYAMDAEDWAACFKKVFWDAILGDSIESQRIANMIVDWIFTSGQYYPELHIQELINHVFKRHIAEDGHFGPATIDSINGADEELAYNSITLRRKQYYSDIVETAQSKGDHTQDGFLKGWLARVDNLVTFNSK